MNHFLEQTLDYPKEILFKKVVVFSDGCAAQFKGRGTFAYLNETTSDRSTENPNVNQFPKQQDQEQPINKQPDQEQPIPKQPDQEQSIPKQPDQKQPITKQPDQEQPVTKQPDMV